MSAQITFLGVIAWTLVTYWQPWTLVDQIATYDNLRSHAAFSPPRWLFGMAWSFLYAFMSLSIIVFWNSFSTSSVYTATLILYLINIVLNKIWTPTFFRLNSPRWAFVILFAMLSTAIAVEVLFWVGGAILSALFYLPYPLWLLFTGYWSYPRHASQQMRIPRDGVSPLGIPGTVQGTMKFVE